MDVEQNDPGELLEVFDSRGRPTGQARARAAIHLAGDWHQAFHCWIVRGVAAERQVVLQRRSPQKDTFPSCWDAAAAGHWRFGESAAEAAREVEEELGIRAPFERLVYRGRERLARRHPNGLIDREFHQVYVLDWPLPLTSYRPDPAEVSGLVAVAGRDLLDLAGGRREEVPAMEAVEVLPDGRVVGVKRLRIRRGDLVPYSAARLRRLLRSSAGV